MYEALLEENASLRGKLAESRFRTVRLRLRNEPGTSARKADIPSTVEATISNALKGLHDKEQGKGSQPKKTKRDN